MSYSLQGRLSIWLSGVALIAAACAGIASFWTAYHEAIELQDGQLDQVAALVTQDNLNALAQVRDTSAATARPDRGTLVIQQLADDAGPLALASALPDGIQNVVLGDTAWRVVVRTLDAHTRIAVAQQTAGRDDIAHSSAVATVAPFVAFVPVLVAVLGLVVRRMFRPVREGSALLDRRAEHDLSAIPEHALPEEIRPFVVAINRLLERVAQSVAEQKRFIADAAHELRSPLTALSLQAERLDAASLDAEARARLAALRGGLSRSRTLIEQLLVLARVQDTQRSVKTDVPLDRVARQVLEDLMPLAEVKALDIGFIRLDRATVQATEMDIRALVTNLVDNAIRYTPHAGRIDMSVMCEAEAVVFAVADSGPGIAPKERERVFDPFYRVTGSASFGSGLGLSIVKAIATRIGAQIDLAEPSGGSGLVVSVRLARSTSIADNRHDAATG